MTPCTRMLFTASTLALAMTVGPALAATGPMDFLFGAGMPPSSERMVNGAQRIWKLGEFSALRLAESSAHSTNSHPVSLDPATLQMALLAVQFEPSNGVMRPLFQGNELQELSITLAKAFAVAKPQDEVLLMASARYDGAMLGMQRTLLARLFYRNGQLNLVVKDARAGLLDSYRASNIIPAYDFGSDAVASQAKISAVGATQIRFDWLALDLGGVPKSSSPAVEKSASPSAMPTVMAITPSTQGSIKPDATPANRDKIFFEQQAQRLEGLKALRDKDLISESEYQQKRNEILLSL